MGKGKEFFNLREEENYVLFNKILKFFLLKDLGSWIFEIYFWIISG